MDAFAILHIRARLDAGNDKQIPHYQPHCSLRHWVSKRAWHRELMASKREKAGMALGEEGKEDRVGARTKEQPSRTKRTKTGHTRGRVVEAIRRSFWGCPLPISEPKGRSHIWNPYKDDYIRVFSERYPRMTHSG